tara:strand:- start:371914 stop:372318 length:405 start_codon:yes stop_codon:yes gene_type:complete
LSLDDKKQQLSQMIDMAKFGRRHNKSNKTYDFLSRDGTLVECRGPFYERLNFRRKSDIDGKPMALLIVYLGKPERFSNHRKDFNACSVALRKVEFMMLQDAASSIGLPFVPDEITPTQMIGVDQNFKILYDSEK